MVEATNHHPAFGPREPGRCWPAEGWLRPDPSSYAGKFSGSYSHRTIEGGVGHNLPQEAPEAFADAVIEVDAS